MSMYHEPADELSQEARNVHRALASLIEELEAVDWYNQRVDLVQDTELKSILAHNRDEEIEHAAMTLEWLRRQIPKFDEELKTYLFSSGPITEIEESAEESDSSKSETQFKGSSGNLGVGDLRKGV